MHRQKPSFGKAFEDKGDLKRAIDAYKSAGLEDDVKRVIGRMNALDEAASLEELGFYERSADILIGNGLAEEAGALSERLGRRGTPKTNYVKIKVLAEKGDISGMDEPFQDLVQFGAYGKYLFGRAVSKAFPEVTRRIADSLSGKPIEQEEGVREKEGEQKLYFKFTDAKQVSRTMMSFLSMDSQEEMAYFAMRLYQMIGDGKEAERCLSLLDTERGEDYRFYAALARGGPFEVVQTKIPLNHKRRLIAAITDGNVSSAIIAIERGPGSEEEKYQYACELLGSADKYVPELLDIEAISTISCYWSVKRENICRQETLKLEEFEVLAASGDLQTLKEAIIVLGKIKLQYVDGNYWRFAEKCADSALGIGTVEAVKFAGEIYGRCSREKEIKCAEILLKMGEKEEARKRFGSAANSISYQLYSDREDGIQHPGIQSLKDRLLERAFNLEGTDPASSLSIYRNLRDGNGVKRTARAILKAGSEKEIENAAWAVSTVEKDGFLMRDLLLRLEEFGEEGKRKAYGIRGEMTIPKLFVARNGTE